MQSMLTVHADGFPLSPQPQPFPLQGSKRSQVPIINSLIPAGAPRLIEPFCGSAAVSIGARREGLVSEVHISDSNSSLMSLWNAIIAQPRQLSDGYEQVWSAQFDEQTPNPKRYFNLVRERHNAVQGDDADFLFLLNRVVKAALRYGKNGKMNQSADGRRVGARPATVRQRLTSTSALMQDIEVSCRDWTESLSDACTTDILYLDPPYQGTTGSRDQRYIAGLSVDEFESGVRWAVTEGLSVIVSYDAVRGPAIYGRPLDSRLNLVALDVVTGVSAQGTLLGRKQESHETIYLSPALVDRLGGPDAVYARVAPRHREPDALFMTM